MFAYKNNGKTIILALVFILIFLVFEILVCWLLLVMLSFMGGAMIKLCFAQHYNPSHFVGLLV